MPLKNSEESQLGANAVNFAHFALVEALADAHAVQLGDAHLRLAPPLTSKKTFNRRVSVNGNHTEVQITVESIGSNGVKYLTDAILRATKTDKTDEKILTMHTQIFASRRDTIPVSTDLRTVMLGRIIGAPESNCRWDELFVTVVDKNGVHRSPVARCKTFL
jgi:hypothetical protein